jgi:hypothetical protein
MFGSGMAKTVLFDRGLSSAVAWMKWDLFRVPGVGEDLDLDGWSERPLDTDFVCVKIDLRTFSPIYDYRDFITTYGDLLGVLQDTNPARHV